MAATDLAILRYVESSMVSKLSSSIFNYHDFVGLHPETVGNRMLPYVVQQLKNLMSFNKTAEIWKSARFYFLYLKIKYLLLVIVFLH